jgi:hypothetical protein
MAVYQQIIMHVAGLIRCGEDSCVVFILEADTGQKLKRADIPPCA